MTRSSIGELFPHVLAAAQAGAGWAAERLWRSLAPAVTGYLRLQGAAEPEDLASETFVGVFGGLASFTGTEAGFRSWVFTIAHRRLVDERRRAARQPMPAGPRTAPPAEELALGRLGARHVEELCRRLVPDQRDVLLLRLVAALTVEEAAAVLGKSAGAVKALQRRGLAAVRRAMSLEGVPL